jgi:hypothetical protein
VVAVADDVEVVDELVAAVVVELRSALRVVEVGAAPDPPPPPHPASAARRA